MKSSPDYVLQLTLSALLNLGNFASKVTKFNELIKAEFCKNAVLKEYIVCYP